MCDVGMVTFSLTIMSSRLNPPTHTLEHLQYYFRRQEGLIQPLLEANLGDYYFRETPMNLWARPCPSVWGKGLDY